MRQAPDQGTSHTLLTWFRGSNRLHQCVGGVPCLNCSKTNRACQTRTNQKTTAPIFVHTTQQTFTDTARSHQKETALSLSPQAPSTKSDTYLKYFFRYFLHENGFTGIAPLLQISLSSLVHYSPELYDAINAISALHLTQHSQVAFRKIDDLAALQAYSRAVHRVQDKIATKSLLYDPSALWTTLLLGVFEVSNFSFELSMRMSDADSM